MITFQLLQIFFHVLLNAFSICACFLAAGITGLYGTAVQLPQYDQFLEVQRMSKSTADVCIVVGQGEAVLGNTLSV